MYVYQYIKDLFYNDAQMYNMKIKHIIWHFDVFKPKYIGQYNWTSTQIFPLLMNWLEIWILFDFVLVFESKQAEIKIVTVLINTGIYDNWLITISIQRVDF